MFDTLTFKGTTCASALAVGLLAAPAVDAATLNGTFSINIYQSVNANSSQSAATEANIAAATFVDTISYTGDLSFGTFAGTTTTIGSWLATGAGVVTGLDGSAALLQLSKGSINSGTATTTLLDIVGLFASGFNAVINHDDGITVFDDGVAIATSANPTIAIDTPVNGFDGGTWRVIHAATNSDPSVLRVTGENLPSTVPLPAAGFLLVGGLGGLAALRRRKALAA